MLSTGSLFDDTCAEGKGRREDPVILKESSENAYPFNYQVVLWLVHLPFLNRCWLSLIRICRTCFF
jgi:hypothetical protein